MARMTSVLSVVLTRLLSADSVPIAIISSEAAFSLANTIMLFKAYGKTKSLKKKN
jgi:hypothetical protein